MSVPASLRAGRWLSLSPPWQDESARIVFDRHSGDYWLLTHAAADLLQLLLNGATELPQSMLTDELVATGLIRIGN